MQYFDLYHTSFFKEQKAHNLMFGQSHNQEQWSKEEMISGNKDQEFRTLTAKTISRMLLYSQFNYASYSTYMYKFRR